MSASDYGQLMVSWFLWGATGLVVGFVLSLLSSVGKGR